jgi:hypothetical protein
MPSIAIPFHPWMKPPIPKVTKHCGVYADNRKVQPAKIQGLGTMPIFMEYCGVVIIIV